MKSLIYRIIYNEAINPGLIHLLKLLNKTFGSKLHLPPTGILSFELQNSKNILLRTNQTSYLTKLIYWKNIGSFEYTNLFIDLIKETPVFLDIGSTLVITQ